jgi:membrane protein implicated in regulation of membrane protease activity
MLKLLKNGTICGIIRAQRTDKVVETLYNVNEKQEVISMSEITQTVMYIIWAVAIVVFGVFEAVTAQLVSIWFVLGSIAALISAFFGASFTVQVIIFTVVTILALVITRPLVKKYIHPHKEHTNADKVLDQIGVVTQDIDNINAKGQVKVDGKTWTARAVDNNLIPSGSEVKIEKIEGVKLIVKNIL